MNNRKVKTIINLYIVITTLVITILGVFNGASSGQVGEDIIGLNYFMPYTVDSNVFLAIVCLIELIIMKKYKHKLPKYMHILSLMATTGITITFLVVVFFLTPSINNPISLYLNDMLFLHVLNPILAIIGYIFYTNDEKLSKNDFIYGLTPVFIYSIVYLINVVFLKTWNDIYGFTFGSKLQLIPIVIIVMYSVTLIVSKLLIKLKK